MLRIPELYPPGCFVLLAGRETGVVVRRGSRARTPVVASLLSLKRPLLRSTAQMLVRVSPKVPFSEVIDARSHAEV